jgi:hypothetical protein
MPRLPEHRPKLLIATGGHVHPRFIVPEIDYPSSLRAN